MKVIRFVSASEAAVYLAGGKLMSAEQHSDNRYKTTSVGFCFAELTEVRDADKWMRKLMGLRICEYCIEFETDDFTEPLTESRAIYADDVDFEHKLIEVREWCTISYSLATHPYRRIGQCPTLYDMIMGQTIRWFNQEFVNSHCCNTGVFRPE